ncbi:hypothetical protein [Methanoregula formicica]|nr:hypothetical protein [Methanoregula formicica]
MAVLAVAGSIVAGMHYYAVDLPQQKTVQAPANVIDTKQFHACIENVRA